MYHLIDLTNQTRISFETKIDLLAHWRFRLYFDARNVVPAPLNFKDLNITGNDMYGSPIVSLRMRRFQVLDDDGRSLDIRTWAEEIEIVNAMKHFPYYQHISSQASFRIDPAVSGSKTPRRKDRCGALTLQRLRDRVGTQELDYEDELLGFTPIRDNSAPRSRNSAMQGDGKQRCKQRKCRSWKSHTKNTSQWARHIERAAETPIRKRIFDELDVEKLIHEIAGIGG